MNILSNTTLPTPRVAQGTFTDADWAEVLGHLADVIGPQAHRYATVQAAKLIAAIGYLAGSEDADRFAVSNLLTFHGATKARLLFNHRANDDGDVLRRLATIQYGSMADRKVVDYGMTLLALISLGDHVNDVEDDRTKGKYNPVGAGKWDARALLTDLQQQLQQNPVLKKRFEPTIGPQPETLGWWSNAPEEPKTKRR